ncbi:MAG: Y-family DNA polymerase [Ginsengibacter sp.]
MYALVDCNNFYPSCECLFQPKLKGKPVVVLSNNDGCVIARSDEAKALGIVMGTPAHLSKDFFTRNGVEIFSSNYTLYGDMSDRVMKILSSYTPVIEVYSIDEAFLDFTEFKSRDLLKLGVDIRKRIMRDIGIPVSVGIAPNKTLAKMANKYAKKAATNQGTFLAGGAGEIDKLLDWTKVGKVWGIGHQYELVLNKNKVFTAKDFDILPADWVRTNLNVTGLRTWYELKGQQAISLEVELKLKQNICTSRSFAKLTNDYSILEEAVSNYASSCAAKLRSQHSACREVSVFIATNVHKMHHLQHHHSITIKCETPTNLTGEIIKYALKGLAIIYGGKQYLYMKAGVIVKEVIPVASIQANLFDNVNREKESALAGAVDIVNRKMGTNMVRMSVQRFDKRYQLRADHLSAKFTTDINQILKVNI